MDLYPVLNNMKSDNHDMKSNNKQNPGNKQNWPLVGFGYRLDQKSCTYKKIKPGEFDIAY